LFVYIVLLHYTAAAEEVSFSLPDHAEWLTRQYNAGYFLVSGRREPRVDGAVILAKSISRGKLDALLATDPFAVRKLATYEVLEFSATRTSPVLASFADYG
jgi:uncharacterized protein YciI